MAFFFEFFKKPFRGFLRIIPGLLLFLTLMILPFVEMLIKYKRITNYLRIYYSRFSNTNNKEKEESVKSSMQMNYDMKISITLNNNKKYINIIFTAPENHISAFLNELKSEMCKNHMNYNTKIITQEMKIVHSQIIQIGPIVFEEDIKLLQKIIGELSKKFNND